VELAQRLYYRRGWFTANSGRFWNGSTNVAYAYQIYGDASAMGMTAQANGAITSIVPGDMIVHGQGTSSDAGHVAVVDYIDSQGVHVVEQNYSSTAHRATYGFATGTLSRTLYDSAGYLMPILGIVHSSNNPNGTSSNASGGPGNIYLGTDHLSTNGILYPNRYILSSDSRFVLVLQGDGNLVEYGPGWQVMWSSNTAGTSPGYAMLQNDGNFVLRSASGTVEWQTNTGSSGAVKAVLQTDGNFVMYNSSNTSVYSSSTGGHSSGLTAVGSNQLAAGGNLNAGQYLQSADGRFILVMQTDGNLVLYGPAMGYLWASNTNGSSAAYATLQASDGNFVLYDSGGHSVWDWHSQGLGGTTAVIQSDGNFVLDNSSGAAVQQSSTGGQILNAGASLSAGGKLYPNYYLLSPDTRFVFIQQADGNLVLYDYNNNVLWQDSKAGNAIGFTVLQSSDGNLVEYGPGGTPVVWSPYVSGGAHANMQNDGNLVLYNSSWSTAVWQTNTGGH
jgi:hypothetical protein